MAIDALRLIAGGRHHAGSLSCLCCMELRIGLKDVSSPFLGHTPGPRRSREARSEEGPKALSAADLPGASGCAETVGPTRAGTPQTTYAVD